MNECPFAYLPPSLLELHIQWVKREVGGVRRERGVGEQGGGSACCAALANGIMQFTCWAPP